MKKYIILILFVAFAAIANAVPARRGWQIRTQADGTTLEVQQMGDEYYHYMINREGQEVRLNDKGMYEVVGEQPTLYKVQARRQVSPRYIRRTPRRNIAPRGLVILVNFSDQSFNATNTRADMDSMMNAFNYTYNGATGSARQYFYDQSEGLYNPIFDVVGPVTVTRNMAYYGANDANGDDQNPAQLIVDACRLVDGNINFAQYDNDNDGEIDFVYVIYAGKGEADGGEENTIWPHNWYVKDGANISCTLDGKQLNNYACSGELKGQDGSRNTIGTPCHEFGHVLGFPDLYDTSFGTNYTQKKTPGEWSIMDHGSYNNDGNTPPNYSIFDKYYLGWKTPIALTSQGEELTLHANGSAGYEGYQLSASYTSLMPCDQPAQMYYMENRQNSGWDTYLPGHGLIIWSVNYNQSNWDSNEPNNGNVPCYTVVSATGNVTNIGSAADPFPGTSKKTFWNKLTGRPLLNITETSGVINLNYMESTALYVTWMVNGVAVLTSSYEQGDALQLPATPTDLCDGDATFIGWTQQEHWADPFNNPADLFTSATGKTVTAHAVYYAVFK